MIEVDAVAHVLFLRQRDHLFGFGEIVGDRLFTEYRKPGAQQFHRRRVVIAAVLDPGGRHAHHVDLNTAGEHVLHRIEALAAVFFRRLVGSLRDDVADGDDLGIGMGGIDAPMHVADIAHAHYRYF